MLREKLRTLQVRSRQEWRDWLREHHEAEPEVWLVFHKRHSGKQSIPYEDAVEEALCFGWIDSLIKRLDVDRYARKFTPRKADSKWSTANRERYARMEAQGLLTRSGMERSPTERSGDAPRVSLSAIPPYIEDGLKSNARAWSIFEELAPSCRRQYIGWIDSAKREETRQKRLRDSITLLAAGKKLGLK